MIDLIPARPEMAAWLDPHEAQAATGQIMTRETLAAAIRAGTAIACVDSSGPVPRLLGLGGIAEEWTDRGLVWGLLAGGIGATMTPIHRIVRRALDTSSLRRIEAHVAIEHEAGLRWIEMLGFEREGVMRAFWQGRDFALYAKVR